MGLRHSKHITSTKRWQAVRLLAKRRDGFKCVKCQAVGRLEVDHIQPVRTHPQLSFDLSNLQTLCASCHAKKTRIENGATPLSPERQKWRSMVADMRPKSKRAVGETNA